MTVRDVVCHQLNAVSRKRCLLSFSQAHILPCSRALLFVLLLCTPAVVNAQWEPDVRLTYNDSSSYTSHNNAWCIAASGDTVHVVWFDTRDANYEIYYKRSTDGGTNWSQDVRLTYGPSTSGPTAIAVSGHSVHVVWEDYWNGSYEIYYKRSTDGGTSWDPDVRLTNSPSLSVYPSIAIFADTVHVVWEDTRDGNNEIYYKRSTDGGTSWSTDIRLTNDPNPSEFPSIGVSQQGGVHVVWDDYRDGNWEIYYKLSTDGGTSWGTDVRLTIAADRSWDPSVAVSRTDVHVVWEDKRDGDWKIYYKRSTDGGTSWTADSNLTNDTSYSWWPSVAVSGTRIHVVWLDYRDGDWEIYYKRSTDGGTSWETDARLTYAPNGSTSPSVALSGSAVHVVWYDYRDGNSEIYYKRNPTGNLGVVENIGSSPVSRPASSIRPNPFTSFATLPGHEGVRFALYDVSGRKVGVYKGDRIGEGLVAGVYFLRPEGLRSKPLRLVKLR